MENQVVVGFDGGQGVCQSVRLNQSHESLSCNHNYMILLHFLWIPYLSSFHVVTGNLTYCGGPNGGLR